MSIALTTHGMLWPQAAIFREQFQKFTIRVVDKEKITVSASALREIVTTIRVSPLKVTLKVVDTHTGELAEESRIKVNLDCK